MSANVNEHELALTWKRFRWHPVLFTWCFIAVGLNVFCESGILNLLCPGLFVKFTGGQRLTVCTAAEVRQIKHRGLRFVRCLYEVGMHQYWYCYCVPVTLGQSITFYAAVMFYTGIFIPVYMLINLLLHVKCWIVIPVNIEDLHR